MRFSVFLPFVHLAVSCVSVLGNRGHRVGDARWVALVGVFGSFFSPPASVVDNGVMDEDPDSYIPTVRGLWGFSRRKTGPCLLEGTSFQSPPYCPMCS